MRSSRSLQIKTYVLLLLMVSFTTIGNALMDKGMKDIGSLDLSTRAAVLGGFEHIFASGAVWLGILCMTLFLICHMLVLSWADYSFVMPFAALGYALVPLAGVIWLGEVVHASRWMGIALIVFGVILVSRTSSVTTQRSRPAPPLGSS
jgi:undecaprenyl phosphate-alpha-L-ara4N flippase subunit ArnE